MRKIISDEALRSRMVAYGAPSAVINIALGFYEASRAGEFATTNPTLGQLLNRAPITMRDILAAHVSDKAKTQDAA